MPLGGADVSAYQQPRLYMSWMPYRGVRGGVAVVVVTGVIILPSTSDVSANAAVHHQRDVMLFAVRFL